MMAETFHYRRRRDHETGVERVASIFVATIVHPHSISKKRLRGTTMFRTVAAIAILAATTTICGADDAVPETTATVNAVVPDDGGGLPSAGPHKRFVNTASMETGNTVPLWMSSGPPQRFANGASVDLSGASAGPTRRYVNGD